jgi:hyperosmotically inducible protein
MKTQIAMPLITVMSVLLALSVPLPAGQMDNRIESSARQSFVFKTYLQKDIKIDSRDGAVILTGMVAENFHVSLAEETVAFLPGVRSVDNKLKVKDVPSTTNSLSIYDEWIRDRVKATLLFHRSVSMGQTEVFIKNGVVTLRGNAASQAQKELATEYVKDIEGVKDVNNEMTIVRVKTSRTTEEEIDDASITAQVKMALLLHRSTSGLNTSVATERNVVTLRGNARNAAEKELVSRLVNDINGVKSVKNWMTIE